MPEISLLASSLLVLAWEIGLALVSLQVALKLIQRPGMEESADDGARLALLVCVLACDIVLVSTIGSVVAFLRMNSQVTYGLLTGLLLVIGVAWSRRNREDLAFWRRQYSEMAAGLPHWLLPLLIAIWLPYLLDAMQSVKDVDSVFNMTFVHGWVDNRFTPYEFAHSYVAFWEAGYLPNILLSHSDAFFWLHSLKPVLLSFTGILALGNHFRFPAMLTFLSAASAISVYYFWNGNAGIGTIKNDMAVASGVILAALAIGDWIDNGISRRAVGILYFGIALSSVKYTGPFLVVAIWLALVFSCCVTRRRLPRNWLPVTAGAMLVAVLVAGHYFAKNAVLYSNPLYPCQINLFGWELPGYIPTVGTSIWDHFTEWRMWKMVLFPETLLSAAGAFVPGVLVATLPVCLLVLVRGVRESGEAGSNRTSLVFLATLIAGTWFVYVRSFWSADSDTEALFYLKNLASLRFAIGTLAITELFLGIVAYRSKCPPKMIGAVIALQLLSRLAILEWIMWRDSFSWQGPVLFHAIAFASAVVCFTGCSSRRGVGCVISGGMLLVLVAPMVVSYNQSSWLTEWQPIWSRVHELPPQRIAVIRRPAQQLYTYPVAGHRFQHTVIPVDQSALNDLPAQDFDYVVIFRPMYWGTPIVLPPQRRMQRLGFQLLEQTDSVAIYQRLE